MSNDLQSVIFGQIQQGALPTATAFNITNLVPVDEGSLGDLPWFWQNGTNFNASTYNWLNNVFAYSSDGYVSANGQALTTAYNNVLLDTAFVLDAADSETYNNANLAAAATANTLITDWTSTQGPFPTGTSTQAQQLNYIMAQVLTWGTPGLTLAQLRNSTNPTALLPNVPLGATSVVSDLMAYLAQTSSVADIQAAVVSFNAQITAMKANSVPQPPPTSATPGFMTIVSDSGTLQIVPAMSVAESTGQIQNALLPASGGTSFSVGYTVSLQDSSTVQVTSDSGAAGVGLLGALLVFASESSSTNIFAFDSSLTSCTVSLTFNGVTTFTPSFYPYNVSTGAGWWNPGPIEAAANPESGQSGYAFTPTPDINFGVNGDFGVISRLLISQQPVISLTYSTENYSSFQQTFEQDSTWGISLLGIGLGGSSSSYYQATTSQDSTAGTVTLTMSPAGINTPISATDQLAYVIGAEVLWPGAPTQQNQDGL